MNPFFETIPERILTIAKGALAQANTHAVFVDPGMEYREYISVLNAAHAGELFIKAMIAKEHPLLVFRDLFSIEQSALSNIDLDTLIRRGKTHDFEKLPQVLWVTTGYRIPDLEVFERLRSARNAIQHFCAPDHVDLRNISLSFLYRIVDPLIKKAFGLYAIEYHEDHVGYDYIVAELLRSGLRFSIPEDFHLGEINVDREITKSSLEYKKWFAGEMRRVSRTDLFSLS